MKRENPFKKTKSLIKLYFSYSVFYGFISYIKNVIKGKILVDVRGEICLALRHIRPEIGKSLAKFPNN